MEVVEIGRLANGLPVYIDKLAASADGIVLLNRVKPHTAFRGENESGLVKMITIGLGKQRGADSAHAFSFKYMAEHIVLMAEIALSRLPFLFGVATVENAYDEIAVVEAVPAREIIAADKRLLVVAKENMPRLLFDPIDVLVVDEIGKNISGDGMDPNITGRYPTPYASGGPDIAKIVVLDLTPETHGNANGMGAADFTTQRLVDKIDYASTYANSLTSTVTGPIKIPMILATDRDAIQAAIKTCNARRLDQARVVRIKNTLSLGEILISESLLEEARSLPAVTILSEPQPWPFDSSGNLAWSNRP